MATFCRSTLNYSATSSAAGVLIDVEILDGRVTDLPGWTVCGFELLHHPSSVVDWNDDGEIATVHYPEVEALARELTGCDHASVSGHIRRSPEHAARHRDLAPIRFVHSDFADGYDALDPPLATARRAMPRRRRARPRRADRADVSRTPGAS